MSLFSNMSAKVKEVSVYKALGLLSIPAAILLTGAVITSSSASFSGVTENGPQSWTASTVALTDNLASAMFSADNISPGYTETHCITVSSSATVPTALKMYTSAVSATGPEGAPLLSSNLNVSVMEGSGGVNTEGQPGGCEGFVPEAGQTETPTFAGTLASFANNASFENGVGNFTLPAGGTRQYQITVDLPSDASNDLQGTTAGATFMWEAQG